jgi:D-aminopeptidase
MSGRELDPLFAAVVEATEEAVLNSMLAAPTVVGRDGNVSRGLPAAQVRRLLLAAGRI